MKGIKGWKSLAVFAVVVIGLLSMHGVASAVSFTKGDVFASIGNGQVKEFTPNGTLVQTLDTTTGGFTGGSAFDSAGNYYVFSASQLAKFDKNGTLLSANFIAGSNSPFNDSLVFDNIGNFYVAVASPNIPDPTFRKFNSSGTQLNTFHAAPDLGFIDLAADQHTIFYTTGVGTIRRFDTATNTQLPDFTSSLGIGRALRLLPDGGALVANGSNVLRLNSSGAVTHTYTIPGGQFLFYLNLDPDGTTFWTANFFDSIGAPVFHVRISDGTVLNQFNTEAPGDNQLGGLSIFGEITQGCPTCGGGPTIPEPSTWLLLGSGLVGMMLWRKRTASRLRPTKD